MNFMPFGQLKSFLKILIEVQYEMYSIDFVEDICIIGHSGGAASPTTDRLCLQIVDRQIVSPRFLSCSSFAKEKMDGAGAPQVLQHRLSLSAESGIPPRRERARPTGKKPPPPGGGLLFSLK